MNSDDSAAQGGGAETIRYASGASSLGTVCIATTEQGICLVAFCEPDEAVADLERRFPGARIAQTDDDPDDLLREVIACIDAPSGDCKLPVDLRGTDFQQRVWSALTRIPPGETVSYSELARRIGQPTAVRAVAHACASNNVAVVIPCHRVVGKHGSLNGYRWGTARKQSLLDHEAAESGKANGRFCSHEPH